MDAWDSLRKVRDLPSRVSDFLNRREVIEGTIVDMCKCTDVSRDGPGYHALALIKDDWGEVHRVYFSNHAHIGDGDYLRRGDEARLNVKRPLPLSSTSYDISTSCSGKGWKYVESQELIERKSGGDLGGDLDEYKRSLATGPAFENSFS